MPPTFGDTRPTFGYPTCPNPYTCLDCRPANRKPERPSVGVQLGMDGTELPSMAAHDSTDGPHHGSWRTCPVCRPSWMPEDEEC